METITFKCPGCGYLCAFHKQQARKPARCLRCDERFIIPNFDHGKAQVVKMPKSYDDPLPGFYEAAFKKSAKVLFNWRNFTVILFVSILTIVKCYTAHLDIWITITLRSSIDIFIPFGTTVKLIVYGLLFYVYAEIIYATAFDAETFPKITLGGFWGFIPTIVKSLYAFFIALLTVLLPSIMLKMILVGFGLNTDWPIYITATIGLFLFPMAVLCVSITRDLSQLFNPGNYNTPIRKAFWPYFITAIIFIMGVHLLYALPEYHGAEQLGSSAVPIFLALRLGTQVLMLYAMRVIGLFHRHYNCYFSW